MNSLTKHFAQTMGINGGGGGGGSGPHTTNNNHNNMVMMMLYGSDDSALTELGRDELNVLMNEAVVSKTLFLLLLLYLFRIIF